jgi:hypothetical protein
MEGGAFMTRKLFAILILFTMLLPAAALGEATGLPYGFALGMNTAETEAAFAADAVLSGAKYQTVDDGNGSVEYVFANVAIPDTEMSADNLTVQIDQNNSAKEDRLTMVSITVSPSQDSIATFRALLASMTASLGAPDTDPFAENGVAQYVEWGTLDASWTRADVRVSLSLSRMYEESVSILYSSRLNYDEADLAE